MIWTAKVDNETAFVLSCACAEPDKDKTKKILAAAEMVNDWELVYDISLKQRVLPLIYTNIKRIIPGAGIPDTVTEKFKTTYFEISARSLYFGAFLLTILDLLNENDIEAVPLKGPVLAQELYGDTGQRVFSDLDILVRRQDAVNAWQLFLKNGFNPELDLDIMQFKKFIEHEDNLSFFSKTRRISIELHWEMTGFYLSNPVTLDQVEKNLEKIAFNKKDVPVLCSEDLLIYLCIHGTKHGWEYLEQVCCVAETMQKKQLDWDKINETTVFLSCRRMVGLGIYLSWKLLDAPVPDTIRAEIKNDTTIPVLAEHVIENMFKNLSEQDKNKFSERFSSFHFTIRDRFFDRVTYFFRLSLCPTNQDWYHFPLPAWLSFLHYFLRPYRLVLLGVRLALLRFWGLFRKGVRGGSKAQ